MNGKKRVFIKEKATDKTFWINMFGWYGVAAYQIAYILVSFHILSVDDVIYQLINLTGGVGLLVVSLMKKAYQPAISNLIWAVIASIALINILVTLFLSK